ncbi:ComEA family DNA-binding protein [Pseudarthrobacter sp. NPDC058119]|uniref:ComEA family DNA-binding protein n=1 Tax=Pseudarthrobacter sp. NPDC058119 TaxID=3346348 RepID=UPI0036D7F3A3
MSRRDAEAARQQARHARDRLQAALGEAAPMLLEEGAGAGGFQYRGTGGAAGTEAGSGTQAGRALALRWRIGLRVALLLGALAVAAGAWFWWQAGLASPDVLPLSGASSGGSTARGSGADPDTTPPADRAGGLVVVHVAGAVATPGVIRLQQGGRVDDAIAAAGGAAPDADVNRLNLALVVEDGQKIYVPQRGEPVPAGPDAAGAEGAGPGNPAPAGAQPGAPGGKVNLNTADAAELDTLPKVGPVLAQRIVDWRKDHGPFKSVEELDAVDGVGPKMLEALLPLVTV